VFTVRGQDSASFFKKFTELAAVRVYRARLSGHVDRVMSCDAPLAKAGGRLARADEADAVPARSEFRPLAPGADVSLVEVELHGGPTEQISLHAAALGHAIVGDPGPGHVQELACVRVAFVHPLTGQRVDVAANPQDWAVPSPARPATIRARRTPMDLKTITATLALLGVAACGGETKDAKKDEKPATPAASDAKPTDAKPADAKPVDAKSADAKPAGAGEMKCGEGKCGEGKCGGDAHGGEKTDGKTVPVDAKPADAKAADAAPKPEDGKKT
jgi:hypothetical protein